MKVLFFGQITKRGRLRGKIAPSTRVRCINLAHELERRGFSCTVRYRTSHDFSECLNAVKESDAVVFHRLQFPMTSRPEPPTELFLHIVSKAAGRITVFDLDDAIFLDHPILTEYFTAKSDLVTVGSHQLAIFASRWNRNVHLLPSAVNTDDFAPSIRQRREGCVLGWHGTAYVQVEYLRILVPILGRLAKRYDFTFKLLGTMGDRRIQRIFETIPGLNVDFGPDRWIPYEDLPSLIADVDIGLSPLTNTLWSRSKCAMKALEYMSMGIPVVASPVGEHSYLIQDGMNGLLASSENEWVTKISRLIDSPEESERIGQMARRTVLKSYSLAAVADDFANMIQSRATRS